MGIETGTEGGIDASTDAVSEPAIEAGTDVIAPDRTIADVADVTTVDVTMSMDVAGEVASDAGIDAPIDDFIGPPDVPDMQDVQDVQSEPDTATGSTDSAGPDSFTTPDADFDIAPPPPRFGSMR